MRVINFLLSLFRKQREEDSIIMDEVEEDSITVDEVEKDSITMDEREIYDAVSDVKGIFSTEFKKYVESENLLCHKFRKYDLDDDLDVWLFIKDHQPDGVESAHPDLTNKLMEMLKTFSSPKGTLLQFWRAKEVTSVNDLGETESRFILTTHNQPFLISGPRDIKDAPINEGICSYRMKTADIVARDEVGGGVIGRVFWNKRIESSPQIFYYSCEENPHRDLALGCCIKASLSIPLSDSSSGRSVGVLEIVSKYPLYFLKGFLFVLQESSSLRYLRHCKDLCGQCDIGAESLHIAVSEIREVLTAVGRSCRPSSSQTWMLCNSCGSLSISESLDYKLAASYTSGSVKNLGRDLCSVAEYLCTLKKGEGVVGKAAISSHNLVYCEDVSQFSITDYPLAHFARGNNLDSHLAICLKSDLTISQIYVLEFIFSMSRVNIKGMRAMVVRILKIMRETFQTFKLASGEEMGGHLSVLVIDARSPDKIVSFSEMGDILSVPVIDARSPDKIVSFSEMGDNLSVPVTDARSPDKIVTLRKRKRSLDSAISMNTTQRPYLLPHSIGETSTRETDDPITGVETSFQDTSTEKTQKISCSTVQSVLHVTVMANYGGKFILFGLSSSSGIHELSQQVSHGLNLEVGTYIVKYLDDDNDSILIACDDDLRLYISSSISKEEYTLKMLIEPIKAS